MPKERRQIVTRAFWTDQDSREQQAEAVELIARQMKFRSRSVRALDLDRKARYLASLQQPSESIASRVLVAYHLDSQRPMMRTFLDALGISHNDGLIDDDSASAPDQAGLAAAASALLQQFPREDVALYFSTLLSQDPDTWGGLAKVSPLGDDAAAESS